MPDESPPEGRSRLYVYNVDALLKIQEVIARGGPEGEAAAAIWSPILQTYLGLSLEEALARDAFDARDWAITGEQFLKIRRWQRFWGRRWPALPEKREGH